MNLLLLQNCLDLNSLLHLEIYRIHCHLNVPILKKDRQDYRHVRWSHVKLCCTVLLSEKRGYLKLVVTLRKGGGEQGKYIIDLQ